MRPVLFRLRGVPIYSYPAMLYVGMVTGVVAGNRVAHAIGLDAFRVFVAIFLLIVPALLGARLLWVACNWSLYRRDLRRIWDRGDGGAAQYGGLLLILPLSIPVLAVLGVPFAAFWDVAAIAILVAMIFTRAGCLLNGCCSGRPARVWGLRLPNHAGVWEKRIPSQCLEAGLASLLLAVAALTWGRMPFPGALCLCMVGGYGAGRLVLESTREQPDGSRFTLHHAISLLLLVASTATQ
jgi:phosphatidylglycerol:prolipoprotein diacylglycerol transferase